jgi:predicted transposase YbfD/YdcC
MPNKQTRQPDRSQVPLVEYFSALPDPRLERNKKHKLIDIIVLSICAVVAGCDASTQIVEFGRRKEALLRKFLELPHGIPSHDTVSRVLRLINPAQFQECFIRWAAALREATGGRFVAIDGKTLRRSFDKGQSPLHLVSAWCTDNGLSLGQRAVEAKSNEITAIPELVDLLELKGTVVTIDAAGCQRAIASAIRRKKGDYVLIVKKNQEHLYEDLESHFQALQQRGFQDPECTVSETHDKGHGREERRQCQAVPVPATVRGRELWKDLQTIGRIESHRTIEGVQQTEVRYCISSLPNNARQLGEAVRTHWMIENGLHWVLDVTFAEDQSRIRKDYGPQNMAALRRLTVTLLKQEPTKQSIATKRLMAGWDDEYLFRTITGSKI